MASVVDTSVKHFHSGMVGAPVLSGTAGALIALLDACLINGFDLKAATSLVVAGGVATLSFAGSHSATVDSVVLVAGSSIAELNGEQKITVIGSGFVKFATAAIDGTATGTISFKMAPVGWLKPFSGTNLAVYKSADVTSTGMYCRVDDTGTMFCRLRGFEAMTDVSTGTGLFPLDAQISGGGYLNKSSAASVIAVKWRLFADSRGMYLNITGYSASSASVEAGRTVYIGDIAATRPGGDPYAFIIGCGIAGGYSDINGLVDQQSQISHYAPRDYHALGGSVGHSSLPETGNGTVSGTDTFFGPFPSKIDGGLRLSRRYIANGSATEPRGTLPGLYTIPQSSVGTTVPPGTVIPATGVLAGRNLMAVGCGAGTPPYPSVSLGISLINITGPWR